MCTFLLTVELGFEKAVMTPEKHSQFGLSVELCDDSRYWPKPYAEGLSLEIVRKTSFWDRMRNWFR